MKLLPHIHAKEQLTRRRWRSLTAIRYLYAWCGNLLIAYSSSGLASPERALRAIVFNSCITLIPILVLYHCAYNKKGIKDLTAALALSPLTLIKFNPVRSDQIIYGSIFTLSVLETGLFVWWYLLSWQMRQANKRLAHHLPTSASM